MAALTPAQVSLQGAIWIDVNTMLSLNTLPDRLPDEQAIIYGSLTNLFNCPIGERSRIFQPTYGLLLWELIHEPIDEITAGLIQTGLLQSLATWEPRIGVDLSNSSVQTDLTIPGYVVTIAYSLHLTQQNYSQTFVLAQ
jgi:uncharacterized protein